MTLTQLDHVLKGMKEFVALAGKLRAVLLQAQRDGVTGPDGSYANKQYPMKRDSLGRPCPFRPPEMRAVSESAGRLIMKLWPLDK